MIKKWILTGVAVMALTTTIVGLELKVITELTGAETPAGRFYFSLTRKIDVVVGFSSEIPTVTKEKELDVDLLIGLQMPMIGLGRVDYYFVFDNYGGVEKDPTRGGSSEFHLESFSLSKHWMYALNESIDLGVRIGLIDILLDGTETVRIITGVSPALGITIRL